ncbi:uncharacterized protein LOC552926 [Danio rerio]|uniref:Uncharacterized protein LOC552926 n=1 Tax=Danio rerio TaxID=7955 RepID=Q52KK8_DANRE|nr:uncharacterized protein LOC552926 [Danio rerio]AAH94297.1 Zgc:113057 [Danio rerio]|eukprot:NP_001018332.1 uncharacterized protein LOC552926 [Danio rerio]
MKRVNSNVHAAIYARIARFICAFRVWCEHSITLEHILFSFSPYSLLRYIVVCLFCPQVRVADLLIKQSGVSPEHIAILTPYNAQVSEIKMTLEKKNVRNVTVCTVMKSQGSEWPYVIVSTVRSCSTSDIQAYRVRPHKAWLGKRLGFVTDANQVNVAITRAQDGLCILGNSDLLRCCELWDRLLDHYYRKSCVVNPASDIRVKAKASEGLAIYTGNQKEDINFCGHICNAL